MGRCRAQMDVTLKLLMDIGDIRPGNGVLHVSTRDQTRHADLDEEGIITFQGERHRSLSSFAVAAIRSCGAVGRKTANGWQVVTYKGRPLEQYRADFLEKQSQDSISSRENESLQDEAKKRNPTVRRSSENPETRKPVSSRESASEIESTTIRTSDSGGSHLSSSDITPKPLWIKAFTQKRVRPSSTWWYGKQNERTRRLLSFDPTSTFMRCVDGTCGITVEKTLSLKRQRIDEKEDDQESIAVHMWLKKALNKRHREECGTM